jgi:hypothetical protein
MSDDQAKKTIVSVLTNRFIGPFIVISSEGWPLSFAMVNYW